MLLTTLSDAEGTGEQSRPAMWLCLPVGALAGIIGGAAVGAAFGCALAWGGSADALTGSVGLGLFYGVACGLLYGALSALIYGGIGGRKGAVQSALIVGLINPFLWWMVVVPMAGGKRPDAPCAILGLLPPVIGLSMTIALDALYRRWFPAERLPHNR